VVILTKAQADTINRIFESQKAKIAQFRKDTKVKDSIIAIRDTLVMYYSSRIVEYKTIIEKQTIIQEKLDTLDVWLIKRAKENAWIYYSYNDTAVVAVDLSKYAVRKDDFTGDLMFYRIGEECDTNDKKDKEPRKDWHLDIAFPVRPKLKQVKLKENEKVF
jgi:hypothetical protein